MARKQKLITIQREDGTSYERSMPGRKGSGSLIKVGGRYYVKIHAGAGKYRKFKVKGYKSSDGKDPVLADQYRRDLLGQIARGELVLAPDAAQTSETAVTVGMLLDQLVKKYQEQERKSTEGLIQRIEKHMRKPFGSMLARDCSATVIEEYVAGRRAHAENATINRELAAIRTAFKLGHRKKLITLDMVPYIEELPEADPRSGFIELADYDKLYNALPDPLKPVLAISFFSGVRRGECISIRWDWVDWGAEVINLPGRVTKNGNDRFIPIAHGSELRTILENHLTVRDEVAPGCPWVCFWYGNSGHGVMTGDQIRDFRAQWKAATKAIGQPKILWHDLRRSAVKLMMDAGESEVRVMAISGHKTRSVFERYFQQRSKDVANTGKRVADYVATLRREK